MTGQNLAGPVLHNMISAFFGKMEPNRMWEVIYMPDLTSNIQFIYIYIQPDSGCMLAVMAITGCNQNAFESDPACLLGLPIMPE